MTQEHMMKKETIEERRRRLRFRSWHRGTKETDLLLGSFADKYIADFTEEQLDQYETLMAEPDADIYNWYAKREEMPPAKKTAVMDLLMDHQYSVDR